MIEPRYRSPAHVPAQAAAALPRWLLLGLLAAYIVPGLFGHDLWTPDAQEFGRMWTLAHGHPADWWLPNVAGAATLREGPLPAWVGALAMRALGGLAGDPAAAAVSVLLWFALGAAALWSAAYRLARREEAQPVALVFGGEASRRDYARMLADISLLLYLGTIGIAQRLHEVQADCVTAALVAATLFCLTAAEWRRGVSSAAAGAAIGGLALTQGPLPAVGLLIGCGAAWWLSAGRRRDALRSIATAAVAAFAVAAAWPALAWWLQPRAAGAALAFWRNGFGALEWVGASDAIWLIRNATWFTWPLWPLAAWAVYAWRLTLAAAHLGQPLLILAGLAASMVVSAPLNEHQLVALVPPLVLLAAFGATTLRRALDNLVDWFAIAVFSLFALFVWAYFVAMMTGSPRAMAASIARLAPGFEAAWRPGAVLAALAATALWAALVAWRIRVRPRVLWRGPLLSAGGVVMLWFVVNALYLPAVDYIFSLRMMAQEIATQVRFQLPPAQAAAACIQTHRVPLAERAMLAYYGRLRFDRDGSAETCPIALQRESSRSTIDAGPPLGGTDLWMPVWEGHRRARPDETWRLWLRR
jgi:4-amino-4-deoxy-L-arabinose transferase-like glycosyltransferase